MAHTTSLAFPNLFNVTQNRLVVAEDNTSIVNRVKLLILTEPTELYNNLSYGVGLKRYLFQYNSENVLALIKDKIVEQLKLWEPSIDAEKTVITSGLIYSGSENPNISDINHLKFTVMLVNKFGQKIELNIDNI